MRDRCFVRLFPVSAVVAGALLVGCSESSLVVANENTPDVDRVFATPPGVEAVISKVFQQMHQGQYGTSDDLWTQSTTMAFESSSNLGNFGMGTRGQIPRNPIANTPGNPVEIGNFRDFDHLSRNTRIGAANAIKALNAFKAVGGSFSSPARHARAKSFAFFALGFGHGNVALFYDSGSVITPNLEGQEIPPLSSYGEVMEAALGFLDSAMAIANSADASTGADGWPIPGAWMGSTAAGGISLARWNQIIRSYKARFRAGVARTPAEREDVDWTEVVADAAAGIQSDIVVNLDPNGTGWSNAWMVQAAVPGAWHQMTPMIIGMADTSGAYDAWLATALMQRAPFLIKTPDKRFPSGEDRAAQQAQRLDPSAGYPVYTSFPYFRNRRSGDTPSEPWGTSYYDNFRFFAIRATPGNLAPFAIMTRAEVDMLAAEGHLRLGAIPAAAVLIDRYRTPAGLAPVAGMTSLTAPVPGGNACVPRVPQPPNFTSTACGTIFEAMKWEKRIETAFTGYAQWYLDSRGWGDLAEKTALQWPVPYQEMDARGQDFYNSDEIPNNAAPRGTYGF
jgi:hypothetical protein